jgi:hypothetical protein
MFTQSLEGIASCNVCFKINHADLLTSEKLVEDKKIVNFSKLLIQKNRRGV